MERKDKTTITALFSSGPETAVGVPEILSYLEIDEMTRMSLVCRAFSRSMLAAVLLRQSFSEDEYLKMLNLQGGIGPDVLFMLVNSRGINFTKTVSSFMGDHDVLTYACYNGYVRSVTCLLYHIRHPSSRTLVWAAYNNQLEVVQLLLEDDRIDPGFDHNSALRMSAAEGHTEVVEALLAHKGVDPGDVGNLALGNAVKNKHASVVEALIADPRVDPSDYLAEVLELLEETLPGN